MDLRTVVTILTLLLIIIAESRSVQTSSGPDITETTFTNQTTPTTPATTACSTSSPSISAPDLGLLIIKWSKCVGDVNLILNHPYNSSSPVCYGSETNIQSVLRNVCENKKGCKDAPRWVESKNKLNGYDITETGAKERNGCKTLRILCTVEVVPDDGLQGQLQGYKVVTALLCCVLLFLLLFRFTKPTVKALQKRFSDRRQNRWVGPTQSHSVSYHRGKTTTVKNNDGEKRLSYPALERLAVSDSREPSSNRNSDYNF
ncbi:uncharacterized protein LOC119484580 isoform X2 [Sebastes umbrosus]|uniref:uncharacterized protein LOC119484580 isoform X2 n=1 Tax=Sebastes umbrosus TaxID=72105 RepID=UPI00189FA8A2|nr:uncharacterized protein LOC119484580 isoform X2 [Sebastes umbrosus]